MGTVKRDKKINQLASDECGAPTPTGTPAPIPVRQRNFVAYPTVPTALDLDLLEDIQGTRTAAPQTG